MFRCSLLLSALLAASIVHARSVGEDNDWWKTATFYQIYPKSFKDSDGDGIGDLEGIIQKLDYLQDLGVTGIWLSPIYKSPLVDEGYDISDFRDINPLFGDLKTFVRLVEGAHSRGLKVVLDYVPNHTSDQHEWFKKSENGEEGYEDYFLWVDGKDGLKTEPPNNWISVFKNSVWEWSDKRNKFYLHQFFKQQPDLNFFNDKVRKEMRDILNYWLEEYGVDGVRIDAVPHLVEAKNLTNEPRTYDPNAAPNEYDYLDHIFTRNQPESYDLVYEWRSHIDEISKNTSQTKICMTEAAVDIKYVVPYYGTADGSKLGAHFSFNFVLLGLETTSTAGDVASLIHSWVDNLPKIYTSNWVLGNHDNHRIATKAGKERVDCLNMLSAFLPGIQVTYNGEEIGMENGEVNCETQGLDHAENCTDYYKISRDFERTPLQWDNSEFAGFTDGKKTWLPVSSKKAECNVKDQLKDEKSHLSIYKKLQRLRPQWRQSEYEVKTLDEAQNVLQVVRYNEGGSNEAQLVFNFGSEPIKGINLNRGSSYEVVISSSKSSRNAGDEVDGKSLNLDAYETLILKPKV
ncbi:maltase A2-like [Diabrotica undecimpunctata]|uniref:maltase A2-like n=1 Tax=Diabrotica undecimpunctata TaxID=50387 RepID=UPI003B64068A